MKKTADSQYDAAASISQEKIAERAKLLWENYGRPHGRDTEIWLEAERQLLGVDAQVEGSGGISVSARPFDVAVAGDRPVTRMKKKATEAKSAPAPKTKAPRKITSKTKVAEDAPRPKSKPASKGSSPGKRTKR